MQIVLKLTKADGSSELVTIKAGESFRVPDGVSVDLVSLDGVDNLQVQGGELVLTGAGGTVHIAGLGADFLTSTASIGPITLDGPLPDGYLHLLQWDQDSNNNPDNALPDYDTGSHAGTEGSDDGVPTDLSLHATDVTDDTPASLSAPQIDSYGDDTGATGDGITADTVLLLAGTAEADTSITIYDGATEIGVAATDSDGNWQFTTPTLNEGSHDFSAVASGGGAVSDPSPVVSVTVDTTPPAAPAITSFANDSGAAGDGITSDTVLTLEGAAEANATVEVFDGATSLGVVTADGAGAWTFVTATLAEGVHDFSAIATDAAGNQGAASASLSVEIDTTAPAAPTLDSYSSDSGVADDGVTSDTELTLSGTAEAAAHVTIYDGATVIGTAIADGAGNWSFDTAPLNEGAHSFTATAGDAAGNVSGTSGTLAVTIDAAAPSAPVITNISDDTGVAGDGRTADNTLTLTGTAEAGATVELFAGTTSLGETVADGDGNWSMTTGTLGDASYAFTAVATDAAGNESAISTAVNMTVDTSAPEAPAITGYENDSGVADDGVTADTTPTLTGTAGAGETITVYDGATELGRTVADGTGDWTFTADTLADGEHSFTATATNAVGTTGNASDTLAVIIDATAPAAPDIISISDDTNIADDGVTSDNTLTFTGTAEAGATVNVYDGATLVATGTADGDGNWSAVTAALVDGDHSFTAKAVDVAGNISLASAASDITIDTTRPDAPTITDFSDDTGVVGDAQTADNTLTFTGTAEAGASIGLYDGATLVGQAVVDGDGNWTATTGVLANGTYVFTAVATDAAGNASLASSGVSVTVNAATPDAPVITSYTTDSGATGDALTNDTTPTLSGTAGAGDTITVYDGATKLGTTAADGDGHWSFTAATLVEGDHNFTATATNVEGTTGAASGALALTIDTTAPNAPVLTAISDDTNIAGDGITRDNSLTFSGTAEAGATVNVYDGATLVATGVADSDGNWSAAAAPLVDGDHTFTAKAVDAAGNTGFASAGSDITIDTAGPDAPAITGFSDDTGIAGDGQTADNTLTFTGTAEAGATVNLFADAVNVGQTIADSDGNWTVTTAALANGSYSFTAVAIDVAGNSSFASTNTNVTVNSAAPDAPVITGYSTDSGAAGDGLTNDATPTISGTAVSGETISVYDGATLLGTTFTDGAGNWHFTSEVLVEGDHSFTATATNPEGTTGAASDALALTIDLTAPAAPIVLSISDDTNIPGDGTTKDNTLTFVGTAEAGATVNVYLGATVVATAIADGDGNWTATTDVLADGYHSFGVRAFDAAGNGSSTGAGGVVVIDTSAPVTPVITGYSSDTGIVGDNLTSDTTLSLNGTAAGAQRVSIYDGATLLGTAIVAGGGAWSFTTAALNEGEHSLTVVANDAAGNLSDASTALVLTVDTTAPAIPVLSGFSTDSGIAGDGVTNDNTLTITGTADAGATINIYSGVTLYATAIADGDGNWSATTGPLGDGVYSFYGQASDAAGNASAQSNGLAVRVDTSAPVAPEITGFSNDSGVAGDGVTNDQTLTLTGTAEVGSTVTVFDGATELGVAIVNGSGIWSYTTTTLLDGVHDFTARANDQAGNQGDASAIYTVTIDTSGPANPVITGFSEDTGTPGDSQTNDTTLTFTGTALAGATVNVYVGASIVATGVADGDGNWTATTGELADGYTSFTARAMDEVGNLSGHSNTMIVVIDTEAPAAPVITGYASDTGVVGDGLTSDATITLSGTAAAGSRITIYDGATALGEAVLSGASWTFTTAALPEGDHSFTAVARDGAGNFSDASNAYAVEIDTTPPAPATITYYGDDTGYVTDRITADTEQTIGGNAPEGSIVTIYDNGIAIGSVAAEGESWTFTTPTLADGVHAFTVKAGDAAGNLSAASSSLSITIDTEAPPVPVISSVSNDTGVAGDGLTNDTTLTLTGTAVQSRSVDIYDGDTKIGSALVDGAGNWSFNTAVLSEGDHDFTVISSDGAGNVSDPSDVFAVTVDLTGPSAPIISGFSDDTGVPGDNNTADKTITFTGTADVGVTVNVLWNGVTIATGIADGDGNWSATSSALGDGYYSLDVRAVDAAGNSTGGNGLTIVIDATPPVAPVITGYSDDTGTIGDGVTADNTLVLTGTAEAFAKVTLYDGAVQIGTATADNTGAWSISTAILSNGEHSFTATAQDRNGNVGDASTALDVTVNNVPLTAPVISSFSDDTGTVGDGQTSDNTLTFTGTADAGLTVNVYSGGTLVATGVADGDGHWSATTAALADGYYTFTAKATNGAATSTSSTGTVVNIDTEAPTLPTITSFANDSGVVGDGVTNDTTITLSGTGEANTFVLIHDGATYLGTANVDVNGNWTYTTSVLAEGDHSFTATPRDAAGNVGAVSGAFDVEIDTTRPNIPVITSYSENSGNPNDFYTNDNTLTFSGTAGAGETVNVYLAGQVVATGVADGDGNWSATTSVLADSSYASFTARAFDEAGNSSLSSSPTVVAIDTVAPGAPVITGYSNDSGTVGDGITNDQTLMLNGTMEAGASVTIYDGGTLLGTATSAGGVWSFTTGTLSAGAHSLTAVATDPAGNVGEASIPLALTIDITAPATPNITGYSDNSGNPNDYITNDNTLTFTGTAEAGVRVNIYLAGQVVATGVADGDGNWSATTSVLADSSYASFTARASDIAGNLSGSSAPTIVAIDTVAPEAPTISGYSNDGGVVGDGITNDTTLILDGTATGASSVSLFDGETLLGTAIVDGGGHWTFNTATLAAGEHSFTVVAKDSAGNASDASTALVLTIDTTPPAAPTITNFSDNTGVAFDSVTNDNTLTFTGTAGANETVNVYLAGQVVATGVADADGNWSATTGVLADNSYASFTVRAVDVAGNASLPSAPLVVVIDTVAPDAPIISGFADDTGAAGDGVTADNTLTLTGTASGAASVQIYDGATLLGTAIVNVGAWTFATGVLADGDHSFTVKANDVAGNVSEASAALDVTVTTATLSAPVIAGFSDETGLSGTGQTSDNTLTFAGTAEAGATVNVYSDATIVATGTADGDGNWSATTATLADGYYSFTAQATNGSATSASSSALLVIVDTVAPATPTITDFSNDTGTVGDGITADTTLTLTGTAENGTSRIYVYDGATLLGFTNPVGTSWSFDTSTLGNGAHNFSAVAMDAAGNTSDPTVDFTVTVNGVAPAAPIFDSVGLYTNDNTPTFTGTAEANATVNVYLGAAIVATGVADGDGHWTATAGSAVADGFTYFYAKAVNDGGVSSGFSDPQVLSIDTVAPGAPIIVSYAPDSGVTGDGITNNNTPSLSGTAESGVQWIRVYDGATLLGTTFVNAGVWTFNSPIVLFQGEYNLTATAVDYAGNESAASNVLDLIIDTSPPASPSITSASGYTSDNTPTFTGTAEVGVTVNVYLGATVVATSVADGDGNWTATVSSAISDGYNSFYARAVDAAGNSSVASSSNVLSIDTVAPATPVVTGYSSDLGVSANDNITSDRTLQFSGTSESNSGNVLVYDGATLLGSASAGSGTWSFTTGTLDGGEHSFTFVSRDNAGNESDASTPLVVTIDAIPPAAPVFTSAGGYSSDNTPTFTGAAEAGATLNIYLAGSIVATTIVDGSGNWTATVDAAVGEGYQAFTARAVDVAGNLSPSSSSQILTIDTVAPAAPVIGSYSTDGGVPGDGITNDTTPTLTGTAATGTQRVEIYDGATLLGSTFASGGNWTFTSAALGQGEHTFTVKAFDYAGNASEASSPLVITIDSTPPAAPTLDNLGTYLSDNTPTFTGTAEANATINVYFGGQVIATGIADGDGHWSATTASAIADGYSVFTARTVDVAGNLSPESGAYIAFVDTVPPGVPSIVSFATDTDTVGDGVTSDNTITLSGTSVAGTHHVDVYDGATLLGTAVNNGSNWTFTTGVLPDGDHQFTATAYDYAGNESAHSGDLTVTVDTGASSSMMMGFSMSSEPEGYTAPDGTAGNDNFHTTTNDILHVDGGPGLDTLHFSPVDLASSTLDLTSLTPGAISSVERLDLTGGVDASVTLNAADILSMSDDIVGLPGAEKTRLTIVGDAGDSVTVADAGWSSQGHLDVGGISFNVFEHGSAQLLVQTDVPTNGLPTA